MRRGPKFKKFGEIVAAAIGSSLLLDCRLAADRRDANGFFLYFIDGLLGSAQAKCSLYTYSLKPYNFTFDARMNFALLFEPILLRALTILRETN